MWLLNVRTRRLQQFLGSEIPAYAILSHTWGQNEVSFHQLQSDPVTLAEHDGAGPEVPPSIDDGRSKIAHTCELAIQDGLEYVWVDTCCIDKTSSAELSEAINSMFHWYHRAEVCYAYLSDVHTAENPKSLGSQFRGSRWFTRGWTLQELLAPPKLRFYSRRWELIAPVTDLYDTIEEITSILPVYLRRVSSQWAFMFRSASIATRMSWAANRNTTRVEDMAYCLLGLFNVNMPLLYGEGDRAFLRLQEEIIKQSDDETILAWGWGSLVDLHFRHGFLATSPADFLHCGDLDPWPSVAGSKPLSITSQGLQLSAPIKSWGGDTYALLQCSSKRDTDRAVGIPLTKMGGGGGYSDLLDWNNGGTYWRLPEAPSTFFVRRDNLQPRNICIPHRPWWPNAILEPSWSSGFVVRKLPKGFFIDGAWPFDEWSPMENVLSLDPTADVNQPRFITGRCTDGAFVVRIRWVERERVWVCEVARRPWGSEWTIHALLEEELEDLRFGQSMELGNRRMWIRMSNESVFGKQVMVIDIMEMEMIWAWELAAITGLALGIGAAAATVGALMRATRRR